MILSELFCLHFVVFIVVRITLISLFFLLISVKCSSFSKSDIKLAELNRFNITCQAHGSYDKLVFEKDLLVSGDENLLLLTLVTQDILLISIFSKKN